MASTTRRMRPGALLLVARMASEIERQTIRTGWSTAMGAQQSTVEIAVYNALGTDTIPARPTLEPSMLGLGPTILAENRAIVRTVNRGGDPTPLLDRLASTMESGLRATVLGLTDPPNAPSTIKKKGFDDPLVGAGPDGGRLVSELASQRIRR